MISSVICFGQTEPSGLPVPNAPTGYYKIGNIQPTRTLGIPKRDTTYTPSYDGQIVMRPQNALLYYYDSAAVRWRLIGSGSGILTGANNGLSLSGTTVQLGGVFTKSDTLDYNGDSLHLLNGFTRIKAPALSQPIVSIENTTAGASEQLYIVGDLAAIRMFANGASPFAAITQFTGGILRNSYGMDGPANHVFLCDLRNSVSSATFEINGSTLSGFSGITGNFWMGGSTAPDTAALNIHRVASAATSTSQQILLNASNYGSTFNTNAGAITNRTFLIDNSATRSAGANNLTNVALWLRARNGQINQALVIDSGDFVMHRQFISTSAMSNCDIITVNNASSTQKRYQAEFQRSVLYNDTAAGAETFSSAILARNIYSARGSVSLNDNLSGNGGEIALFPRRNTAYIGNTIFQGATAATNSVTTMPTAMLARLDVSQSHTGGSTLTLRGYWAALTAWVAMNTSNTIDSLAWINTGAAQESGGSIISGFGIYINRLPSLTINKYSIYQEGPLDTNYIGGITRHVNLISQTDTAAYKPMAVSDNGTVVRMTGWPTGGAGMAIGGNITSATEGSVLFAGASGVLAQDNAAFNYTDANNALYVDSVRSLRVQAPIVVGGTGTTDDLILRTTTGIGAAGADMIFQGGTNGSVEFARFLNSGNFGVGVTNPTSTIHSAGDIKANGALLWGNTGQGRLTYSGNDAYMDAFISGGALFFRTNAAGTTVMKMLPSTGRVLIGSTTDLGRKLQVTGSAYITDSLLLGNLPAGANTDSIVVINANVVKKVSTSIPRSPLYNAQSGTSYTVLTTDASTIIGLSNTAARTITLAAANAYPAGTIIWFKDEAGTAGTGNITINRAGADTIDGATSTVISTNYGLIGIYTNGSNAWFVW